MNPRHTTFVQHYLTTGNATAAATAAVAATMAKARLLGLDKPKPAADSSAHTVRVILSDDTNCH